MPGQFVPSPKNRTLRRGGSRVSRTGWEESGPLRGPRQIAVRAMYRIPPRTSSAPSPIRNILASQFIRCHAQQNLDSRARWWDSFRAPKGFWGGFPSGRLKSSNEGTWVLSDHDSSAAPQTVQTALPVCGTKNVVSVRLYSAPQLHRTIVAILRICPYGPPDQPQASCPRLSHASAQRAQAAPEGLAITPAESAWASEFFMLLQPFGSSSYCPAYS